MNDKTPDTRNLPIRQVLVFDGDCALCNSFVDWCLGKLSSNDTVFVGSQGEAGQLLLSHLKLPENPSTVLLIRCDEIWERSDAVLELAESFELPWQTLRFLKLIPRELRDFVYRKVASVRYRFPVHRNVCRVDGSFETRMLDREMTLWPEWLLKKNR